MWALCNIDSKIAVELISSIRDSEKDKDVLKIIDRYLNLNNKK